MRKIAKVPIQTWRRWNPNDLFGGSFSALGGLKTLIGAMGLILEACLILPCLVPLMLWSIMWPLWRPLYQKKKDCPYNDAVEI
jgi:hypothetical protein